MSAAPVTSTTAVQSPADALTVFTARCEARAVLWACGEILDLHEAVDALRRRGLADEYAAAFDEWEASGEAAVWEAVIDDGILRETR